MKNDPSNPSTDPEHPTDELMRFVLEEHQVGAQHDVSDEWVTVTPRAVAIDFLGPKVELGPWSFTPDEARLLSSSLALLADIADRRCQCQ